MSGGSLDYFYITLQDHENDFGDKELNELVHDLAELFHDREWYLSADTGVGDWNEARDAFKAIVKVDDFDDDRRNECSTGIHFFITRQEAVDYVL